MDEESKLTTIEKLQSIAPSKKLIKRRVKRAEKVTRKHARKFILKRIEKAREVQRKIVFWVVLVGVIIACSALQLIWFRSGYVTTAPADTGIYIEGMVGQIKSLNPIFATTDAEESLSQLMFSRLFKYDTSGVVGFDLVDSMTVSQNGLEYVFKLREDALWQDGEKLSADDVLFTFELLQNPSTRSSLTGWSEIKISKVDSHTVKFVLPSVIGPFKSALASVPILPKHLLSDIEPNKIRESAYSSAPVGSGPFKINLVSDIDLVNNRRAVLMDRFENYYGGSAHLEKFQLQTYADSSSLLKGIINGEVLAAVGLDDSDMKKLSKANYELSTKSINTGTYAIFNLKREMFSDQKVRKSLQLATDTAALREIFSFKPESLDNPLMNSQLGNDIPQADKFDLERAKNLLDSSGWKLDGSSNIRKKDGKELTISIITIKGSYEQVADKIVSQWSKLGANLSVAVYNPSDASQNFVQDIIQPRNYDVLIYPIFVGGDPDVFAYWHSSQANSAGYNFSNYSSTAANALLDSARSRTEPNLRRLKYIQFSRQWQADVPAIGLYQNVMNYAHTKSSVAFGQKNNIPSLENRFSDVKYWYVSTKPVYKTP